MKSIEIPNSVTIIEDYVFYNCSNLASIEISNSVTSIGKMVFNGCDALKEINCMATVPPDTDNSFSDYSAVLNVPMGCADAYNTAEEWCNFW